MFAIFILLLIACWCFYRANYEEHLRRQREFEIWRQKHEARKYAKEHKWNILQHIRERWS